MSTSSIPNGMNLPYPDMNSTNKQWKYYFIHVIWARILTCIHEHLLFKATALVITSLLPYIHNYTEEFLIGSQAKLEKVATEIMKEINAIQDDFNKMKNAKGAEAKALVKDALKRYYGKGGVKDLLEQHKDMFSKDFIHSIEAKFDSGTDNQGPVFGKGVHGEKDFEQLLKNWQAAWKQQPPVPPTPTVSGVEGDPSPSDEALQIIENGFNDATNALSSQNSTVQARIKYEEASDERLESMIHNTGEAYVELIKHAVSAMQSGA